MAIGVPLTASERAPPGPDRTSSTNRSRLPVAIDQRTSKTSFTWHSPDGSADGVVRNGKPSAHDWTITVTPDGQRVELR
jgi:hypothetical protein